MYKQVHLFYTVYYKQTCNAICLSAIKDGCMFPISFFGGSGKSMLAWWRLAWRAAKSRYLRDTCHLFSLLGPRCTRKMYSYNEDLDWEHKQNTLQSYFWNIVNGTGYHRLFTNNKALIALNFAKRAAYCMFVDILCIFNRTDQFFSVVHYSFSLRWSFKNSH